MRKPSKLSTLFKQMLSRFKRYEKKDSEVFI